jgi:hypothetical protein
LLVIHRPISHGYVCPLCDEARLLIDVSRAIETTRRPRTGPPLPALYRRKQCPLRGLTHPAAARGRRK